VLLLSAAVVSIGAINGHPRISAVPLCATICVMMSDQCINTDFKRLVVLQVFPAIDMNAQLTASEVVTAVCHIQQEVPFVEQPALLSTAHDLLLLFHYIYAPHWRLAMAICLNQQTHLQQMRQRAPKVLSEVRARLAADESLRDFSLVLQM
jgi:hypothetical protein